jgi:hypothetical protein
MTDAPTTATKRALLIGIDAYPQLPPRFQLSGCVNDVRAMATVLRETFGFPAANITVLENEAATQADIRAAVETLIGSVKQDDIVVIEYSGHGSQVTDIHGDEASGLDNTIVPHDSGRGGKPNRDITDDEIHVWLSRLSKLTPYITLLFDCCHSGSISRDAFGDAGRWVEPDTRPKEEIEAELASPAVTAAAIEELKEARRDLGMGGSGLLPLGQSYLLIAGCSDEESSYEHTLSDGPTPIKHGALTYFLSQELVKAPSGSSYRDVFERAAALVSASHPRQHPQIEGRQDRLLFGTRDLPQLRFVPVTAVNGAQATLGAGAAHGLTVGSQWAVYPQATKQIDGATRQGLVEITAVRAVSADAKVIEQSQASPIAVSSRAVEEAHSYGDMRLVVDLADAGDGAAQLQALGRQIADSALLRLRAADEPLDRADLRVYLLAPRTSAGPNDPVPQLARIDEPTWAVIDREGRRAMPLHTVAEPGVAALLCENLEKIARYRNALALRNPNSSSQLQGKVGFTLKRQQSDGSWTEATPDPASGHVIFHADERIAVEIVNRHSEPVYISVLDFGLTNGISLFYPPSRSSEKFEPGKPAVKIGEREEDRIDLFVPESFAYDAGVETFKLFATTQPADFSWLAQGQTRGALEEQTPLEQLFALAYTGGATRDVRPIKPTVGEDWITIERSFLLQAKPL